MVIRVMPGGAQVLVRLEVRREQRVGCGYLVGEHPAGGQPHQDGEGDQEQVGHAHGYAAFPAQAA